MSSMRLVTGDDTGLIKVVDVMQKSVVARYGSQSMGQGIEQMIWAGNEGDAEKQILLARKNGNVECCQTDGGSVVSTYKLGSTGCAGLGVLQPESQKAVTCTRKGMIQFFGYGEAKAETQMKGWSVGKDIRSMEVCPSKVGWIATGGKEELLKVWDVESKKAVFKSKNVKPDMLDLRQPVCINDIAFLPHDTTKLVTATAHHEVRLYDTKSSRRAVLDIKAGDNAITRVHVTSSGDIIAGDGAGETMRFDPRNGKMVGKFKGVGGAITCISSDSGGKLIASTSLDRFLRVYNSGTRKLVKKVYLKQRLARCLFSEKVSESNNEKNDHNDKVWDILEAHSNNGRKRKMGSEVIESSSRLRKAGSED